MFEELKTLPKLKKKLRVAAYVRVSVDKDTMLHSFTSQVSYYKTLIAKHKDWSFVDVYADYGISGTKVSRPEFNRMVEDARSGKLDLIITKSVSRFARNTLDTITYIRDLKAHGVECYFQKENIYTFDSKWELLITIMSSLAQEESRSISENVKWGIRKSFADGKVYLPHKNFLGYKYDDNKKIVIDEKTAPIVRLIYKEFLSGKSFKQIGKLLKEKNIKTPIGKDKWTDSAIKGILTNEKYYGAAVLQKTFIEDFLTHKTKKNEGEVSKYYVKDNHPPIIPKEEWDMVQLEIERRAKIKYFFCSKNIFSSKLICSDCGHAYGSKVWHSTDKYKKTIWQCNYKFKNEHKCLTPTLNEEEIKKMFLKAYNKMIESKEEILTNLSNALNEAVDTSKIDKQIEVTKEEINKVAKEVEDLIYANLDKKEEDKKQAELENKYDELVRKLKDLEREKTNQEDKANKIKSFISSIKDKDVITEFNEETFNIMIAKAIVNIDKSIKFIFNSGYEVEVEAEE